MNGPLDAMVVVEFPYVLCLFHKLCLKLANTSTFSILSNEVHKMAVINLADVPVQSLQLT